jgi:hypothetical protein
LPLRAKEEDLFLSELCVELFRRPQIAGEEFRSTLLDTFIELRVWLCLDVLILGGALFYRITVSRLLILIRSLFSLSLASTSTTRRGSDNKGSFFKEAGI